MQRFIKQILAFVLSIVLIIAPTYSFAASSWSVKSVATAGIVSTIVATKDGASAALRIAPSAGRVGSILMRGANYASIAYAVVQILGEGIDWAIDPNAQAIIYADNVYTVSRPGAVFVDTPDKACSDFTAHWQSAFGGNMTYKVSGLDCRIFRNGAHDTTQRIVAEKSPTKDKSIPINTVAAKVIANAKAGHSDSQQVAKIAATEMVISGAADTYLQSGAVPGTQATATADDFTFGAVPGSQTDTDVVVVGRPKSSPADAARDAREAAEKAKAAAEKAADAARDAQRDAADAARDVINAANDAKEAADEQAADAAAADRARAAAEKAAAADRARAAAEAADNARAVAQEAADRARAAADAAAMADKLNPSAANKAAKEQALRDAAAADRAVADAIKAAEKAKAAEKEAVRKDTKAPAADAFELPDFCSWAKPVCDAVDWLKKDPDPPVELDIEEEPQVNIDSDVRFGGSCPNDMVLSFTIYERQIDFVMMPYSKLCPLLSTFIWPTLVALGSFQAIMIVGGRNGGS